jgi:predicted nucleic acid-binding protein
VKYLLDSDVVVVVLKGQTQTAHLLQALYPDGLAISVIALSELHEGIVGSYDPRKHMRGLRRFLKGVRVLGVSRHIAERNAELRADLRRRKRDVSFRAFDLLIAATALQHNLTLVTRNRRDYQDIPGLTLH